MGWGGGGGGRCLKIEIYCQVPTLLSPIGWFLYSASTINKLNILDNSLVRLKMSIQNVEMFILQ